MASSLTYGTEEEKQREKRFVNTSHRGGERKKNDSNFQNIFWHGMHYVSSLSIEKIHN